MREVTLRPLCIRYKFSHLGEWLWFYESLIMLMLVTAQTGAMTASWATPKWGSLLPSSEIGCSSGVGQYTTEVPSAVYGPALSTSRLCGQITSQWGMGDRKNVDSISFRHKTIGIDIFSTDRVVSHRGMLLASCFITDFARSFQSSISMKRDYKGRRNEGDQGRKSPPLLP